MAHNDPRYAEVNARTYPPITRAMAYKAAERLLRKLGSPRHCAVQGIDELTGGALFPARSVLDNIFRRYLGNTRQYGSSRRLGRTCWASTKPTRGHNKGWGRLIHDVSHMLQEYRHPGERPHGGSHASIEREVADCVDDMQLIPACSPKASTPNREAKRAERLAQMQARLARWIAKRKRAETAISKLTRQIRATERRQAKALTVGMRVTGAGVPEGSVIKGFVP